MSPRQLVWFVPLVMALLGLVLILLATSGLGWPVALGWAVVAVVFAGIEFRAQTKRTRVFVPLLAILCLPIMTFEGGFLMEPAAVALLAAAVIAPEPRRNRGAGGDSLDAAATGTS
ncbi:MAG TPA: hypothetical protein VGP67_15605 [Gaiellales bacterium]|jgi:hypothetical protein|nr:hypothetical protein [Gaiellales bacterium]